MREKMIVIVSEILQKRAEINTCSHTTAWQQHMDEKEKAFFKYEEVSGYIKAEQAKENLNKAFRSGLSTGLMIMLFLAVIIRYFVG